ncbi:diguanylate cyclase [Salipaludibacillus sp. HK11]|uniref:diguanylate cyclase n=1 Tax=Salipaludibacillus sp. HK11 TaxID=3394320 RepID=UPI0039FBCE43
MSKLKYGSIYFIIFLVIAFSGILFFLSEDHSEQEYLVEQGKLNLSDWDYSESEDLLKLTGDWEFYWGRHILTPEHEKEYIYLPSKWNDEQGYSPNGYATYRMVIDNITENEYYGLKINSITTAYNLYIDGELLDSNGTPGTSEETTAPFSNPKTVFFPAANDSLEVIIHVSNYDYRYGGIDSDILFGTVGNLKEESRLGLGLQMILFGCLILSGFYHLVVYRYRKQNRSAMYFSVVCFLMGLRILVTEQYFILEIFPEIPWEVMVKIEYITFYLAPSIFFWVLCGLYPKHLKTIYGLIFTAISSLFSLFVLFTPVGIASFTVNPYQIIVLFFIFHMLISLMKALKDKQEGSFIITVSATFVGFTAINDILLANKFIESIPLSAFGFVIFILSQSYIIALHSGKAFTNMEKATADLAELNQTLEEKVSARTDSLEKSRDHLNKLNDKLKLLSYNDQLTKIPNRRYLEEHMQEEWTLAAKKKFRISALYIDIDHFKEYNDTYGHEAGDRCLMEVADALKQVVSPFNGYVARMGGEEFVAILSNANHRQVKQISEQCLHAISNLKIPHKTSMVSDVVTVSIGAAMTQPNPTHQPKQLIMEADEHLYKAKENGRNQISIKEA